MSLVRVVEVESGGLAMTREEPDRLKRGRQLRSSSTQEQQQPAGTEHQHERLGDVNQMAVTRGLHQVDREPKEDHKDARPDDIDEVLPGSLDPIEHGVHMED